MIPEEQQTDVAGLQAEVAALGAVLADMHAVLAMHQATLEEHRAVINMHSGELESLGEPDATPFASVEGPAPVVFTEPAPEPSPKPLVWTPS
jgi:hypothetical protein